MNHVMEDDEEHAASHSKIIHLNININIIHQQ